MKPTTLVLALISILSAFRSDPSKDGMEELTQTQIQVMETK